MKRFIVVVLSVGLGFVFPSATFVKRKIRIDDIFALKSIDAVEISHDGRQIAFVVSRADMEDSSYRRTIYVADTVSGKSQQLTNGPRSDDTPRWSPDGKQLAFLSDRETRPGTPSAAQVWMISPEGGEARQLTHTAMNIISFAWAPDGRHMALIATEAPSEVELKRSKEKDDAVVADADTKPAGIYLVGLDNGDSSLLYSSKRHVTAISFSPSGEEIAFTDQTTPKVPDFFDSTVHVVELASKRVRDVGDPKLTNVFPQWSPDGNFIAYLAGKRDDWVADFYVCVVPAVGGAPRIISEGQDLEAPKELHWADDAKSIYQAVFHGTSTLIDQISLDEHESPLDSTPGVVQVFSTGGGKIAFVRQTPSEPGELYIAELPVATKRGFGSESSLHARKLTDLNPQTSELAMGRVELLRWKNKKDGEQIEGLLVTPPDYTPGKKYPLLVVVHGGPSERFCSEFDLTYEAYPVQVFAAEGYVVLMPNPRGSGGYGEKFRKAVVRDWGGGDYDDIQDGVDELIARGLADKNRLGIMGWSYGGFMTAWTITQTPRFRAASVGAGITDIFSFYGTTDIAPFVESYFGQRAWEERTLLETHSAIFRVDAVQTPTLIQNGMEDRRVPPSQAEELCSALRRRGVPVELVLYPRSGHAILEPKLQRDSMTRNLEWFDRHLKHDGVASYREDAP